ncbi:MAG: TolC family protein [Xanthomonadales bacterium]|nr:TolC family protein [Xanthomonadales bacterium]
MKILVMFRSARVALTLLCAGAALTAHAGPLELDDAEVLALLEDPSVRAVEAQSEALSEQAVAARQLPDPALKLGMVALPTDTFDLGQEAMTQLQVGVMQKFPRGRTRELRAEQFLQRSDGLDAAALDRRAQVTLAVRHEFLEVLTQLKLAEINREAEQAFTDLADITQDYYASGRVQQQDVLRASVELGRVQDRGQRIAQAEEQARARLAAWIGDAAARELPGQWPELPPPRPSEQIIAGLGTHPRIEALQQDITAAETGVELARQAYRPEFSLDLTYGDRRGTPPGAVSTRPDLFSVMLVMDLPLFTGQRQDRMVAARAAETSSAQYKRDTELRRLRSEVQSQAAQWRREQERLSFYESLLLPEASFNADSSFEAYQSAVGNLTTLMRARITEFELQLEYVRLQADALKSQARLLYLQGETS